MRRVCRGFAVADGRVQVQVSYPATLDPSGDSPTGSIQVGASRLDAAIRATAGQKIVFGYSQGAQVCGAWMRRFAHKPGAPSPDELTFLLIGNPEREFGHPPWVKRTTPNYTQYRVRDVARRDDGWCNWDGSLRRKVGMLGAVHLQYWQTDPYGSEVEVVNVVGGTTYVVAP